MKSIIALFAFLAFAYGNAFATDRPNIMFIVADDMGYADMSIQGARGFKTPNLGRLAAEGTRFTSFYVAQAVCTASRAAIMTGCYSNRIGMHGAYNHTSRDGISEAEWLLPEMLKERGYATAGMGKWHLGTRLKFHPLRHGFDEWLGIPYSNDKGGKPSNWGKLAPTSITQSGVEGIATRHGYRIEQLELSLFDLNTDPGEQHNVASSHPEVVERLNKLATDARNELGDSLQAVKGSGLRALGIDKSEE